MPIEVQPTPNPNAMKFVLGRKLFSAPLSFSSAAAARNHPLAAELFALEGVYNVFMVQDFVTLNKLPETPWEPLQTAAQEVLANYLAMHESGVQ
jgi:hypothetical protein